MDTPNLPVAPSRRPVWVWVWVGLLAAFALTRLAALTAFPPFVDEGVVVNWALGRPLQYAPEGRLFTVWLFAAFDAPHHATHFIMRAAVALTILGGFAALIGIGRTLAGNFGGLIAGLGGLLSGYHFFFERLALSDPPAAAAALIGVYFAARLARRRALIDALLCGVALFVAIGFKVTMIPYLGVPLAAALTLRPDRRPMWANLRWLIVALGVGGGLTAAYLIGVRLFGYNALGLLNTHNSAAPTAARIAENIGQSLQLLIGYWGLPALLLIGVGAVWLVIRRAWFVPLCFVGPMALYWLNQSQFSRFFVAAFALLLVGGLVGLVGVAGRFGRAGRVALIGGIGLWGVAQFAPLALSAYTDPAQMPLSPADRAEYISSEGSGFGLSAAVGAIQAAGGGRVLGVIANCLGLRMVAPDSVQVECPRVNPNGEDTPALEAQMADWAANGGGYAVLEGLPYAPQSAPGVLIGEFPRPDGVRALRVYRLSR